jgi:hypothetical protein
MRLGTRLLRIVIVEFKLKHYPRPLPNCYQPLQLVQSGTMKLTWFRVSIFAALSFAAGSWITARFTGLPKVEAAGSRVYELRVYHTLPGRLPALMSRFRDHTVTIFNRHDMKSVGYWAPEDDPVKDNELIYILAHPSREAATKNWNEFRADPEWQKVSKASEADGKIVEKVDSTFMDPTDFSALK